jgi:curved DNA-binding protein CbpA
VHRVRAARHRPSTLPDYYKLLGLERGATDVQVEQAYRRCAARIHPDRFHKDAEGRVAAEAQLKELNRAMEILRDPTRRAQYDALL